MSETQATRAILRKRSAHHRTVYANQIGSTTTATDVRLRFGCIESATPEQMVVEDQVDVFLGPIELVGLHQLLGRLVKKLGVPEAVQAEIDKAQDDGITQTMGD